MDRYTEGLREAAFDYGIKRLADRLDMSEPRLYKKLDEDQPTVPLTLADFFRMNRELKDARVINSLLEDLDMVAVPRTQASVSRGDVLGDVLDKQVESGRLAALIHQVIEDGEVDEKEAASLDAQFRAIEAATAKLKAALDGLRKPALKAVGQ
ncbi:phage regulatory CII family protein [Halomonas cupida]|uniref:phage regulatory CII family protein n=1 Tax=Halomonas cupida TaxID=44933 RepID=UPI003A90C626